MLRLAGRRIATGAAVPWKGTWRFWALTVVTNYNCTYNSVIRALSLSYSLSFFQGLESLGMPTNLIA